MKTHFTPIILSLFLSSCAFVTASSAQMISVGDSHTLAICNDGTVSAWGANGSGQLGIGSNTSSSIPVQVNELSDIIAVAAGENHSIALKSDGTVWTWGDNIEGQLGNGVIGDTDTPAQLSNVNGVIAIAAGEYHTVALKNDGTVWTWGWNSDGQLGNGTDTDSDVPTLASPLSFIDVIAIAAGSEHTLVLRSNGQVLGCGNNSGGQLGDGTNTESNSPVQVGFVATDIIAIAAGGSFSMAMKQDGTVFTWGVNFSGQLGDGTTNSSNFPVQAGTLTDIIAIDAGGTHAIALRSNGEVMAWGANFNGALGDGTTTSSNVPVAVIGLTGATEVQAGQGFSVVLKNDATAQAWGVNSSGELGIGTNVNSSLPVQVGLTCSIGNAVEEMAMRTTVSIFPNPSNGKCTLLREGSAMPFSLEIRTMQGQRMYSKQEISYSTTELDLSSFPAGIYLLQVSDGTSVHSQKLVIQ